MAKYVNAAGQPREKCIVAAYALVTRYGANQAAVANVMGCSQSTIASWVKEARFREEINGLRGELEASRDYIQDLSNELGYIEYDPNQYDNE